MIVVDASALVAVVLGEDDAEFFLKHLSEQETRLSVVNLVEAMLVVEARQGEEAARDLELLTTATIDELIDVDSAHAQTAIKAWRRFGKGRHPAALNFGDCFAYATASLAAAPLLFKGQDFTQTDLRLVSM